MVVDERCGPGAIGVVGSGPLTSCEALVRAELDRGGYAAASVKDSMQAMARLSAWMDIRGVTVARLTPGQVDLFVAERRRAGSSTAAAGRGLGAALRVLRDRGVVPGPDPRGSTAREVLLGQYRAWLLTERGLAAESVRCYGNQAKVFLAQLPGSLEAALADLGPAEVTQFVIAQTAVAASVESAKALVTATRSLLRFLHVQGLIRRPLTAAVPAVAGVRGAGLPRGLAAGQVRLLLEAHDLSTAVGLRDHAVLVMLARLGLRAVEVARLRLGDVDWRDGLIVVCGKGSRVEQLPLPVEVGQALAAYVMGGRPSCTSDALFVTARVPHRPVAAGTVRAIVAHACRRAGLPRLGAHRLRHTLASDMLRAGAGLAEVGQVLRHRSQLSTSVYAKVDHQILRTLARPWPGGA
jgi:site-specific recombinase XerD